MKKLLSCILILALALSMTVLPAAAAGFTDVPDDEYYAEPVRWALENGITKGITDTTFGPEMGCTRAQVVTFLWRAFECPEPTEIAEFSDLDPDEYYMKAISWAVEEGITNGTGNNHFDPDLTCTRAQIVTFLFRSVYEPVYFHDSNFTDLDPDEYYIGAVNWAVENKITLGTGGTTFSPEDECTRAQVVTFLYRTAMNDVYMPEGKEGAVLAAERFAQQRSGGRGTVVVFLMNVGYMPEEIDYAMEHADIDWDLQACKTAQAIVDENGVSKYLLEEFMMNEYNMFTQEQTDRAIAQCVVDWNEEAVQYAEWYAEMAHCSEKGLREMMGNEFTAFTPEQIEYGVANSVIDWNRNAARTAEYHISEHPDAVREDVLAELLRYGFTPEQAEYGADSVKYAA